MKRGRKLRVDDLKHELREYGLSVSGNKRVLLERLEEAQKSNRRKLNDPIAEIEIESQPILATFEGASIETVPVNVMLENIVPQMDFWNIICLSISSRRWYRILHNYLNNLAVERYGLGATAYCFSIELTVSVVILSKAPTRYVNNFLEELSILLCCSKSRLKSALGGHHDAFDGCDVVLALLSIHGSMEEYFYKRKRTQKTMNEKFFTARNKLKCSALANFTNLYSSMKRSGFMSASSASIYNFVTDQEIQEFQLENPAYPVFDDYLKRMINIRFLIPELDLPQNTYYWDGRMPLFATHLNKYLPTDFNIKDVETYYDRCMLVIDIIKQHKHLFTLIDPLELPTLMYDVYIYAARRDFEDMYEDWIKRRIAMAAGADYSLFVYSLTTGCLDVVKAAPKSVICDYIHDTQCTKSLKLRDFFYKIEK